MGRRANLTPLTEDQSALVAANVNLVFHVVRLLRGHGGVRRLGFDEAIGIGFLMLVYAARRYDPSKSHDAKGFAAYACVGIRNGIHSACNKLMRHQKLPDRWNIIKPRGTKRTTTSWQKLSEMYGDLYERGWLTVARTRGNA